MEATTEELFGDSVGRRELFVEKTEGCKQVTVLLVVRPVGVVAGWSVLLEGGAGLCYQRFGRLVSASPKRPSVSVRGIIQCLWRSFNVAGGRVASLTRKRPVGVICVIKGHTVLSKFGVPSARAAGCLRGASPVLSTPKASTVQPS